MCVLVWFFFFFFNDTATTEIYTLSLHDALPISRILSTSDDGTIKWWDVKSGSEIRTLRGHSGRVLAGALLPDGHVALTCGDDKTLCLWNLNDSNELRPLVGHTMYGSSLAFSPDGRLALSGS